MQLGRTEEDRTTKVQRRVIIVNVAITHHVDFAALLLILLSYRAHNVVVFRPCSTKRRLTAGTPRLVFVDGGRQTREEQFWYV